MSEKFKNLIVQIFQKRLLLHFTKQIPWKSEYQRILKSETNRKAVVWKLPGVFLGSQSVRKLLDQNSTSTEYHKILKSDLFENSEQVRKKT